MISASEFATIIRRLRDDTEPLNGHPLSAHIAWSEEASPPKSAEEFATEAIFVICNGGMQHTIARTIFETCMEALRAGDPTNTEARAANGLPRIYGHDGKTRAIDRIWRDRDFIFSGYMRAEDKVEFCGGLPHIGPTTKFHLAKNFGADVAKPDVHLLRLASVYSTTPQALCDALAAVSGLKSRTVDLILWMACARGVLNSTTGALR